MLIVPDCAGRAIKAGSLHKDCHTREGLAGQWACGNQGGVGCRGVGSCGDWEGVTPVVESGALILESRG